VDICDTAHRFRANRSGFTNSRRKCTVNLAPPDNVRNWERFAKQVIHTCSASGDNPETGATKRPDEPTRNLCRNDTATWIAEIDRLDSSAIMTRRGDREPP
jgi:hypothetical protein